MVYDIFSYRRPSHVSSNSSQRSSSLSHGPPSVRNMAGIPESLSFDRIIAGGTCPPLTCRDFMDYLFYVERGAENLQFFLWYRDYCKRWTQLPDFEKSLSPEYTVPPELQDISRPPTAAVRRSSVVHELFKSAFTDTKENHLTTPSVRSDPFTTPPRTPNTCISPFDSTFSQQKPLSHASITAQTFASADLAQPFTIQPFRTELTLIISAYLSPGGARELNLSSRDRSTALKALTHTTHPSSLSLVNRHIEDLLRLQSHPNFIRWSICNGNRPRVIFARGLGIVTILLGCGIAVLITLSSAQRGYRALAAIAWVIGIATLWAAMKGMCVVLHGLHHRHVRPWELWRDPEPYTKELGGSEVGGNSWEDEPWVAKYRERNVIRKVFDRELWIEEPALRQIQDTIALQGLLIAVVVSAVASAVFVCLPSGGVGF